MKVQFKSETVSRTYDVEGAPITKKRYSDTIRIIPTSVTVTFTDGKFAEVKIVGPKAKKDDSPGVDVAEETWYRTGYGGDPLPDWLAPFTDPNAGPTR